MNDFLDECVKLAGVPVNEDKVVVEARRGGIIAAIHVVVSEVDGLGTPSAFEARLWDVAKKAPMNPGRGVKTVTKGKSAYEAVKKMIDSFNRSGFAEQLEESTSSANVGHDSVGRVAELAGVEVHDEVDELEERVDAGVKARRMVKVARKGIDSAMVALEKYDTDSGRMAPQKDNAVAAFRDASRALTAAARALERY